MGKAIEALKVEHELILSTFVIVDDIMKSQKHSDEIKIKYANEFLYFINVFCNKCHLGKEETMLFPMLIDKGVHHQDGLIGIMDQDHINAKEIAKKIKLTIESKNMDSLCKNIKAYSAFIGAHLAKEDNVLYPMADKLLNEKTQNELFDNFLIYEEDVVGHGIHAQLHKMIDQWIIEFEMKA